MLLRLEKDGLLPESDLTADAAIARLEQLSAHYPVDAAWRSFRAWVQTTQDQANWLTVKELKTRTIPEHAACTPQVVGRAITNLEELLIREGLMDPVSKILLKTEAARLWCVDEKGISQRAGCVYKGVVPQGMKATGTKPECSWEHISLCTFLPLLGQTFMGIVTPTARIHKDFQTICPDACFWANPGGSNTAKSFVYFVLQWAREVRKTIPLEKSLALMLDTGGGSLLHFSLDLAKVALQQNVKLFFVPGYSTRALMALDQNTHQSLSSHWRVFKQQWSCRPEPLSIFVALRVVHAFSKRSLSPQITAASWKRIGCVSGEAWNRDTLFVQRADEIFSCSRGQGIADGQSSSSAALNVLKAVAPAKTKCQAPGCGQYLDSKMRKCYNCGIENPDFDETTFDVLKRGFRSGWQQNPAVEVPEVTAMTENEQRLLSQVDDIWREMSRRANKKQPETEPAPQGSTAPGTPVAPSTPLPKSSTAPRTPAAPSTPLPKSSAAPVTPAAPSAPLQTAPVPSQDAGLKASLFPLTLNPYTLNPDPKTLN